MPSMVPGVPGPWLWAGTAAIPTAGAYFTPPAIADFLAAWAVNHDRAARVLDPTCGEAVFLEAAARRLRDLGAAAEAAAGGEAADELIARARGMVTAGPATVPEPPAGCSQRPDAGAARGGRAEAGTAEDVVSTPDERSGTRRLRSAGGLADSPAKRTLCAATSALTGGQQ